MGRELDRMKIVNTTPQTRTPVHIVGARTYTRTVCTVHPGNIGLTQCPVCVNLDPKPSAYHCMADVSTSLERSLHNGGKLEVKRAALHAVALRCKLGGRSEPLWGPTGSASRGSSYDLQRTPLLLGT